MSREDDKLQAELKVLEIELGRVINTAVLLGGLPMVKTCLNLLRQSAQDVAPIHEGLAWASGVLEGAARFVDQKPQG